MTKPSLLSIARQFPHKVCAFLLAGKYVGNRPIKLRKSNWKDRQIDIVKKKEKEKKRLGFR